MIPFFQICLYARTAARAYRQYKYCIKNGSNLFHSCFRDFSFLVISNTKMRIPVSKWINFVLYSFFLHIFKNRKSLLQNFRIFLKMIRKRFFLVLHGPQTVCFETFSVKKMVSGHVSGAVLCENSRTFDTNIKYSIEKSILYAVPFFLCYHGLIKKQSASGICSGTFSCRKMPRQ